MKLLLINPRSKAQDALPIPPLGILYLAAYVRDICEVSVIDDNRECNSEDYLEGQIKRVDVLGLTGTTSQFVNARKLARIARKHNVTTIYGGSHASATNPVGRFDYIVKGEGEIALRGILENTVRNKIVCQRTVKNLDTLPFPARDLVPIKDYPSRRLKRFDGAYTHMMTGRGCNSNCIFCSSPTMWKYPRLMSAERVFEEMLELCVKYGFKNIHFQDDTFTLSRKRVKKLCRKIKDSELDFRWSCQTRPDMVDEDLLKEMAEAGCVQIEFGVESGDTKLLEVAQKGYSKGQIVNAFRLAKKVGIATYGFFIIGLPGETVWTWLRSIWFALKLNMDSSVWTVLMPYPGTAVFNQVKVLDTDYSNWLYKRPIIKVGHLGPRTLIIMRWVADKVANGFLSKGVYRDAGVRNES